MMLFANAESNNNNLTLFEHLLCARHCSEYCMCISLVNFTPTWWWRRYYHPQFMDGGSEAHRPSVGSWVRIMSVEGMLILKGNLLWSLCSHLLDWGLFLQERWMNTLELALNRVFFRIHRISGQSQVIQWTMKQETMKASKFEEAL